MKRVNGGVSYHSESDRGNKGKIKYKKIRERITPHIRNFLFVVIVTIQ